MGEESSVFSKRLSVKGYQISVIREQEARVAVDGLQFTVEKKQIPRFARDDMGRFSDVTRRER
jgi:lysylphosphatidylglycerol synthetase-like protein (DUF2156 family)